MPTSPSVCLLTATTVAGLSLIADLRDGVPRRSTYGPADPDAIGGSKHSWIVRWALSGARGPLGEYARSSGALTSASLLALAAKRQQCG
jgi:hypothetical protein